MCAQVPLPASAAESAQGRNAALMVAQAAAPAEAAQRQMTVSAISVFATQLATAGCECVVTTTVATLMAVVYVQSTSSATPMVPVSSAAYAFLLLSGSAGLCRPESPMW